MPKGIPKNGTGGQFKPKEDARRNNAGQRSKEVVQTAAQARALYVQVLHEPIFTPPDPAMTNLEMIVRQHVASAKKGNAADREYMFDRIWGKANQPITGKDGGPIQHEDVGFSDEERVNRIAAIFERARSGGA